MRLAGWDYEEVAVGNWGMLVGAFWSSISLTTIGPLAKNLRSRDARDHFTKNLRVSRAQAGCSLDDVGDFEAEIGFGLWRIHGKRPSDVARALPVSPLSSGGVLY